MATTFRPGERFAGMDAWQPKPGERGIFATLGWRRVEVAPGRAVLEWEPTIDHAFPAGKDWIVHGGMVTAILDTAMGSATWTLLDHDEVFLTADLRTEFYRPARPGPVRATGWVVHKTRRVTFAAAELHDPAGVLLASGRASQVIIDLQADPERNRPGPARSDFPSPASGAGRSSPSPASGAGRSSPSPAGGAGGSSPSPASGGGEGGGPR
jgi:uncharacterized protein (TIGR00369 family)